jgi:hypothetical protein
VIVEQVRTRPFTLEAVSHLPATRSARAQCASSSPHTHGPHSESPQTDAPHAVSRAPNPSLVSVRSRTAARLTLAAAIGLAAGAVTEWSVPHLPFFLEPLGNTAAPWVLVAFAVALTARRMGESLMLAVVTLLALVLGFYVVEAGRGWGPSRHQVELWSVASVAVGPLLGLAAGWLRHAGRRTAALGAGVLGGLLAGEAVWGLTGLRGPSPVPGTVVPAQTPLVKGRPAVWEPLSDLPLEQVHPGGFRTASLRGD